MWEGGGGREMRVERRGRGGKWGKGKDGGREDKENMEGVQRGRNKEMKKGEDKYE